MITLVFTYTFQGLIQGGWYISLILWTRLCYSNLPYRLNDSVWQQCTCWHIFSLISRQSGAHETFWNNSSVTLLWNNTSVKLLSHHFQVQMMFHSVPEIQHTRTTVFHAGRTWMKVKIVICTYHKWFIEWDMSIQVALMKFNSTTCMLRFCSHILSPDIPLHTIACILCFEFLCRSPVTLLSTVVWVVVNYLYK